MREGEGIDFTVYVYFHEKSFDLNGSWRPLKDFLFLKYLDKITILKSIYRVSQMCR